MTTYPKRLIEVDLPIARISAHARREKSIRHGHISTLHIWWARRPLAACRAVVCASLWPDPVDLADWAKRAESVQAGATVVRPGHFLLRAREQMRQRAELHLSKASADSLPRLFDVQKHPSHIDDPMELRGLLLDFLADFADWDNAADSDYLAMSRALTQAAHEALGGDETTRPLVVDPFAGGGAIPLEALRVGADAFASDLNPVAVLVEKVLLEFVPKYGQSLVDGVAQWGEWVRQEADQLLGPHYPKDADGATPVAYLWARTIISEAPGEDIPVEVPALGSMWLERRTRGNVALRWARNDDGSVRTEVADASYADGVTRRVRRPLLEVVDPADSATAEPGTVKRSSVTCPVTGFTTAADRVRAQLIPRKGGAADARLLAVQVVESDGKTRHFRLPNPGDELAVQTAATALARLEDEFEGEFPLVPSDPLPVMSGVFNAPLFGHSTWASLFTQRQTLAVAALVVLIRQLSKNRTRISDDSAYAQAVVTTLALVVDRVMVRCTANCIWDSTTSCVMQVFNQGQSLPTRWEFAEMVPMVEWGSGWTTSIEYTLKALGHCSSASYNPGTSVQADATRHPLPNDSASAVITDPPYYNSVPYADLSDFFYVWLRRSIGDAYPDLFATPAAPKDAEICEMAGWDSARYASKDKAFFEKAMTEALSEARRVSAPNAIGVVVFAHQSTSSWEAMLGAVTEAGWTVTGSWPIDTESGNRLRAQNSAALASSVHLACRPRENPDGSLRAETGEWREVLAELPVRIHDWLPRLADEGVVGADAIFACLGPALEIFSRYDRVEKSSGEEVNLREYLERVWAAVSREALSMIFDDPVTAGLDPDARLTAIWLWTLGTNSTAQRGASRGEVADKPPEDDQVSTPSVKTSGYTLEFDAARKIAQGLGIHLEKASSVVEIKGDKARLLGATERTRYLFGRDAESDRSLGKTKKTAQMDLFAELQDIDASVPSLAPELVSPEPGRTVLDRVHQSMILFAAGRGEALKSFLVEGGPGKEANFWKLAQALSALYPAGSEEKRWVDGVLARKKGLGF